MQTIKNNNDIQCVFPFIDFQSLTDNLSVAHDRNNSNPYNNVNNIDYYTNFDKTDINHLLFDIVSLIFFVASG